MSSQQLSYTGVYSYQIEGTARHLAVRIAELRREHRVTSRPVQWFLTTYSAGVALKWPLLQGFEQPMPLIEGNIYDVTDAYWEARGVDVELMVEVEILPENGTKVVVLHLDEKK